MTDVAIVQHGDMICLTADTICLRRDMYNVRDISCEAICLHSANANKKEAFDPFGGQKPHLITNYALSSFSTAALFVQRQSASLACLNSSRGGKVGAIRRF